MATITAVSTAPATGSLRAGQRVVLSLSIDEAVSVTGAPTLSLGNGASAVYDAATSTATSLHFVYTVAAGEDTGDLTVTGLALNGGSVSTVGSFSLATQTTAAAGTQPYSIVSADLNGDGKLDLVTANAGGDSVSILLGDGKGGFATHVDYAVAANTQGVTAADFNGDGKLDLAAVSYNDGTVSVLLNNGDGTFGAPAAYTVNLYTTKVIAADLNGDGTLDLVTANESSGTISVLLNKGDGSGTFGAQTTYSNTGIAPDVAAADLDGDGTLDLVVAGLFNNIVSVRLGNGSGGFGAETTYAAPGAPRSIAVGDVNGDGKADIVTGNNDGTVSVLLGDGKGGFAAPNTYTAGGGIYSMVLADENGDGRLDVVAGNYQTNTVTVLLGDGKGGLGTAQSFAVGNNPFGVSTGDLNSDGKADIATANLNDNTVSVLLNTSTFATSLDTASAATATGADTKLVVDASAPGAPILTGPVSGSSTGDTTPTITGTAEAGTTVSLLVDGLQVGTALADTKGAFGFTPTSPIQPGSHTLTASATDAAGNVSAVSASDPFSIALPTPAPVTVTAITATPSQASPLGSGDTLSLTLSLDQSVTVTGGSPTLRLSNGASASYDAAGSTATSLHFTYAVEAGKAQDTGDLSVAGLTLNGAGVAHPASFSLAAQTASAAGGNPTVILSTDVDEDGNADLVVANQNKAGTVSVLLGDGKGGFAAGTAYGVGSNPFGLSAADLNGDGHTDLLAANFSDNTVSVLLGTGKGGFAAQSVIAVGTGPTSAKAADVDGDGKADLLVSNFTDNTVSVLLGDGTGGFGPAATFTTGKGPLSLTAADVDGDGKLDLATANQTDNTVSVLLGTGTGSFGTPTAYAVGGSPQSVVAADLNGDGHVDLVTPNVADDTVSVLLSDGKGGFAAQATYAGDIFTQSVTAVDVNGDGKLDLVTANQSGTVSVLLGDGTGAFAPQTTYAAGKFAIAVTTGDFNGDGKADIATANLADATVSALLNTSTVAAALDAGSVPTASGADTKLVVDATAPTVSAPSTASPSNATSLTYTVAFSEAVTGVDASDFAVRKSDGSAAAGTVSSVSSSDGGKSFSVTVTGASGEGAVHLDVLADGSILDAAGNPLALGATGASVTLDHVAPSLTLGLIAGDDVLNASERGGALTVTGTAAGAEDGQLVNVALKSVGGATTYAATTATVTAGAWTLTLPAGSASTLPNGSYSVTADVSDKAGNAATEAVRPLTVDTTAPAAPGLVLTSDTGASASDGITRDARLTVTPAESGGRSSYLVDGKAAAAYDPASLGQGAHTVLVTQTDAAGNASAAASLSFTLDGIAPALSLTGVDGPTNTVDHVLTGSVGVADAGGSVSLYDGTSLLGSVASDGTGRFRLPFVYADDGPGHRYQLTATQTDLAGNTGTSAAFGFTLDFTPNQPLFGTLTHDAGSPGGEAYALYDALLGRAPDATGLEYWAGQIAAGVGLHEAAAGFLASPEFTQGYGGPAGGGSDDAFVQHLYDIALGREPDAPGEAHWDALLAAGTARADVALAFALSPENGSQIAPALRTGVFVPDPAASEIARLYYGLLERAPDAAGLQTWEAAYREGAGWTAIADRFLASPEYAAVHPGAQTDRQYVDELYRDALGRTAEPAGEGVWLADLAGGSLTRAGVAVGITDSLEAHQHLAGQVEAGWHLV